MSSLNGPFAANCMITRRTALLTLAGSASAAPTVPQIRVGCQTRAYGSPLPERGEFLAALDGLDRAGYAGFETNFRSLEKHFGANAEAMRQEIESRGVEMIGLHLGVGLFEPATIPDELQTVRRVARGVKALGGKHLIISGRKLPRNAAGKADDAALLLKAATLNNAGRICHDLGVHVSSHNHTHEVAHDADEIRRLLSKTDPELVSLLFDVGHVHHNEVDVPAFVAEHGERIAGLHIRDVRDGEEVLIGTGKVDFPALAGALRRSAWAGWVIVEVNKRDDMSSDDLVVRARRHLQKTMEI